MVMWDARRCLISAMRLMMACLKSSAPAKALNEHLYHSTVFGDTPVRYNRCWMNSSVTLPPVGYWSTARQLEAKSLIKKGGSNSVVESQPSKLLVAGSIPVSRSSSKLENRNSKLAPTSLDELRIPSFEFRKRGPM